MENAFTEMKIAPVAPSPTPTSQPLSRVKFVQFAQQFLDILKSLSTNEGPPPPSAAADKVKSVEPPARASKLEFKPVNEVFVFYSI